MKESLRRSGATTLNSGRQRIYLVLLGLIVGLVCPEIHAVSWFPFGPDGGSARAFAADTRDHAHLYLGAANGWIYESRDGGKKWVRLACVGKRDDLVIDNILVDPADPKHLVVGAWVPADLSHPDGGLYISEDGGVTWTSQPEMRGQSIRALTASPSDPKIFVAGTIEGVFRSMDSGAHWQRISPRDNAEIHEVESIAVDPVDPNIIYAGTWHLPWKTVDGGKNWISIKQGIIEDSDVFSIVVDPKHSNVLYLSACSGIYKSENSGAKFDKVQGIPTSARRTPVLMQDPSHLDTVFAGTTEGLYRTDDAGKYWMQTTGSDIIVNDVYVDPTDSRRVLLATDRRGVLASDDGGSSFVPSNSGFSARQVTAFTGDASHPATVYAGVVNDKESGGVFVSQNGGLNWSQLSDGLEGRDVYSLGQAPDGTILAGTGHGIYRLKGEAWQRSGDIVSVAGAAVGKPAAVGPAKPGVKGKAKPGVKASAKPALKAQAGSAAKPRLAAKARRGAASAAPSNFDGSVYGFASAGETLYAATSRGLFRSASSGSTWSLVASIPAGEWHYVAASKTNIVVASLDAVEMSTDGGNRWETVALPAKVKQVLAVSVDGQGEVWVGGREGVYFSADEGANWKTPKGLYVRNVNSIFYDDRANRILVTTNGSATVAFAVELPLMQVISWDTGWNLRFVRPVGDHLLAATLFDGMVVQPRMVDSAEILKR